MVQGSGPPRTIASAVEEDLREAYSRLYAQPKMTNMTWLNMFRILSARMGRHKHVIAFLVYARHLAAQRVLDLLLPRDRVLADG